MEIVAAKLRKAEELDSNDLRAWVSYNFLVLPREEQERVKQLSERQQWFWRRMSVLIPPVFYGIYAVAKYGKAKKSTSQTLIFSLCAVAALTKIGLYSSNKDIYMCNRELFDKYKDDVMRPEYRGLKLYNGKKVYQLDNKEFTTSNFDDLKDLVMKQIK